MVLSTRDCVERNLEIDVLHTLIDLAAVVPENTMQAVRKGRKQLTSPTQL